jgi:hypothetical protein
MLQKGVGWQKGSTACIQLEPIVCYLAVVRVAECQLTDREGVDIGSC